MVSYRPLGLASLHAEGEEGMTGREIIFRAGTSCWVAKHKYRPCEDCLSEAIDSFLAAEREACARIAESFLGEEPPTGMGSPLATKISEAIRKGTI
jgi:hypothetical protein